jgi:VIT1/CCC1 family predicted Fe2+/Mn2+ transporter
VKPHDERHLTHRGNVLRAMVLGANDGIISTAALILGVAAASSSRDAILTAGVAGLVAGAASMGLGEYVSVSSQRDSELADIRKETWELENQPDHELEELTAIFAAKGLSGSLAAQVAEELTRKDALKVHLEEELGITADSRARPFQAAASSAVAFAIGASLPLLAVVVASEALRIWTTMALVLAALVGLGYFGARFGGARAKRPIARVVFGGFIAIGFTMAIGWLFGAVIA